MRRTSPAAGFYLSLEAMENLRVFFAILQQWDEEDRQTSGRTGCERRERAARTIAKHFREDVESE